MTLKKLSEQATPGEWGLFDDRGTLEIGHAEKPGERPCIIGWPGFDSTDKPMAERRANAKFIVALVNAYRAGEVVAASPEVEPTGVGAAYEQAIRESVGSILSKHAAELILNRAVAILLARPHSLRRPHGWRPRATRCCILPRRMAGG